MFKEYKLSNFTNRPRRPGLKTSLELLKDYKMLDDGDHTPLSFKKQGGSTKQFSNLSDALARKKFNSIKSDIIREFGNDAMYDSETTKVGKREIGDEFIGTFSVDNVPLKKHTFYAIVNVDKQSEPGSHWVAVYKQDKKLYIYDSFSRGSKKLLSHLYNQAKQLNLTVIDVNKKADQKGASQVCGPISLAWIIMTKKSGINISKKL